MDNKIVLTSGYINIYQCFCNFHLYILEFILVIAKSEVSSHLSFFTCIEPLDVTPYVAPDLGM